MGNVPKTDPPNFDPLQIAIDNNSGRYNDHNGFGAQILVYLEDFTIVLVIILLAKLHDNLCFLRKKSVRFANTVLKTNTPCSQNGPLQMLYCAQWS